MDFLSVKTIKEWVRNKYNVQMSVRKLYCDHLDMKRERERDRVIE